ncbi:DUF2993 domain-containing protein [Dietzia sp. PP-33]|jgi:hypothetical protein|uniref:LmeA family phospholipid-binding protein n=1 Tax=Dietzia sp. PP-33 TaxID=2957500 RepID=UPI0029BE0F41|nr:DUF2993 domain-containing protein [Dietzia sp. PP-33]MDX2356092.1 DUF2993 domain-containing protein [Dietzia sp. PP-33]
MSPRHDTQRFPAHDRPGVQNAETQQFAAAPGGYGDAGGPGSAHPDQARSGRRRRGPLIALVAAIAVIGLVAGVVGLEFGTRNAVENRIQDEVTASLGSPATVELGARPVLLTYFGGDLGSVRITTDGTAAEGSNGPAPAIDISADGVRAEGDLTYVDSLTGTAFVSDQAMSTAAQQESTSGMLGGLIQVQEIVSDPASGTLRVSISGLAEAVVTPRLTGGNLELDPSQATILGFPLPSELLGGTISMMDSALADLPEGVELTGVRVVPGGMVVDLRGQDVVLEATE